MTRIAPFTAWSLACLGLLAVAAGCSKPPQSKQAIHARPGVRLVNPERRTLIRKTGQPGFIEAYEQTSLFPKVSGYVDEWKVDIGARIKKGELIAHVAVPELVAEYHEKQAQAALDEVQIQVSEQLVHVAQENASAAIAQVAEAQANVARYQADVDRWQSEVGRLGSLSDERIINQQILSESRKQLKASTAAREAAKATVTASQANAEARKADVAKARVDVQAAQAKAKVSQEAVKRLAALVNYTDIRAPYDGVVVVRNVDTGDYVQPSSGDLSGHRSIQSSQQGKPTSTPLYVVARTDMIRVFLDVSEMDAGGVGPGSPATVRIQAVDGDEINATVTRTSWALHARTRTLRAEIDLKNPDGRILPNTYAYGEVVVKRENVWTLPLGTVTEIGNQNCCYLDEDGKAVQTPVQIGINDGKWVEVVRKRTKDRWEAVTGKEEVIEADLSVISDGESVRVEKANDK